MGAPRARHDAPLLLVVRAGTAPSERSLDALDAARRREDRVVLATPPGAAAPSPAVLRRLRAEHLDEAAVPALLAAHGGAGGAAVVLAAGAYGPDPTWLDRLVGAAVAADAEHGAALPATNAAPWPACPVDLPDAGASRSDWRTFARAQAGRPCVEVTAAEDAVGPAVALSPTACAAVAPAASVSPTALAAAVIAAGGRVVRADGAYVHDPAATVLLSACLIMKDEETNLPRCLTSLRGVVDEVVIYDTGSTDGSVALARSLGAVVVEGVWDDDFGRARNAARAHCRGQWLLHVDADEEIEQPSAAGTLRARLAAEQRADLFALPLHNMRGTELAPVREINPHWVPRVLHRTRCHWTGALHEHPMLRRGGMPRTARHDRLSLVHYGYLNEVVARLGKRERNDRIAATKLDEDGEAGRTHFDRGRTAVMNGRVDEAVGEYEQAVATATNPIHRRCALELAATALLNVGRADDALAWIEQRAAVPERPGVARWLRARHALATRRPDEAIALLNGITEYADNFSTNGPDDVHHLRAQALLGLGRTDEAAAELVAAVALNPTYDRAWSALTNGADRWPAAITEAARHLQRDQLKLLAAQVLTATPRLGGIVAESLWAAHPGAPVLVAAATEMAPRLEVEDAARWAVRIRAARSAERCPLRRIAHDPAAPPMRRLQAAYLGVELFADVSLAGLVDELAALLAGT